MSNNIHTSARGKQVDMTKLTSQYELTPAVGNVRVNARGDELDPHGQIVRKISETKYDVPSSDTPARSHILKPATPLKNQYVSPPISPAPAPSTAVAKIEDSPNALKDNFADKPHNKGKQ